MVTNVRLDRENKHVILEDPDVTFTVQEIGSKVKEILQRSPYADEDKIFVWSGFDELEGGNKTGIVLQMQNGWLIKAEDRGSPVRVKITQGVILPETAGGDPLVDATNVTYSIGEFSVSSLLEGQDTNVKFLVESGRPDHSSFGKQIYWDPANGGDTLSGESPATAVKTFAQAHSLADVGGNDVIFILGNPLVAVTIITERIVITKAALFLRGTGPAIRFQPLTATDGSPIIDVQSGGFQLESVSVFGSGTGTDDSIKCTNTNGLHVLNCLLSNAQGDAISIDNSRNSRVEKTTITNSVGNGIKAKDTNRLLVKECRIFGSALNGILLDTPATASDDIVIEGTIVSNSTLENLRINSGVTRTIIGDRNNIVENGGGRILDNGTDTIDLEIAVNALKTRRYVGIGVKKSISSDGSNKLTITKEDKITAAQRYTLDKEADPTSQTDDDI